MNIHSYYFCSNSNISINIRLTFSHTTVFLCKKKLVKFPIISIINFKTS